MTNDPQARPAVPLFVLWLVVLLELVSPIPAFLTLGAAYVLLFRPPWFLDLVQGLYANTPAGGER